MTLSIPVIDRELEALNGSENRGLKNRKRQIDGLSNLRLAIEVTVTVIDDAIRLIEDSIEHTYLSGAVWESGAYEHLKDINQKREEIDDLYERRNNLLK